MKRKQRLQRKQGMQKCKEQNESKALQGTQSFNTKVVQRQKIKLKQIFQKL